MSTQGRGLCKSGDCEASKPISEQIQQKTMKSNNGKILKTTLKAICTFETNEAIFMLLTKSTSQNESIKWRFPVVCRHKTYS